MKEEEKIKKQIQNKIVSDFIITSLLGNGISINPTELKIINFIVENEEESISDISKKLNIDYKNCWRYIKKLTKEEVVNLNPPTHSQGKKVFVKFNPNFCSFHVGNIDDVVKRISKLKSK